MNRAVVTGSAGFIGVHLVRALESAGTRVVGLDRRPPPAGSPGVHRVLDLTDPASSAAVATELARADAVFHLAGRPGVRGDGPGCEAARRRDNVQATAVVARGTPRDVPLIVTSSSSVYGGATVQDGEVRACREDDPLVPRGGYARSKVLAERLCARRAARGGLVAVARPFTVAGEGQRHDMALARWLETAAAGGTVDVFGGLDRGRDVTDVGDVVRGLLLLASAARAGAPVTVNLGTGVVHTLRELLGAVERIARSTVRVRVCPAGVGEVPLTRADTDRCRSVCGFVPTTDLDLLVARQWAARGARHDIRVVA